MSLQKSGLQQALGDKGESSQLEKTLPTSREWQSEVPSKSALIVSGERKETENNVSPLLIVRQFFFSFILDQYKVTYNALLVSANNQLWQHILELSMGMPIFLSNDCLWMRKTEWSNENWVRILTLPLIVHITEGTLLGFMD